MFSLGSLLSNLNNEVESSATLMSLPLPVARVLLESGKIIEINEAFSAIFGYTSGDLRGELVEELLPDSMQEAHVSYREKYARAPTPRFMGSPRSGVYIRMANNRVIPVRVGLWPNGCEVFAIVVPLNTNKSLLRSPVLWAGGIISLVGIALSMFPDIHEQAFMLVGAGVTAIMSALKEYQRDKAGPPQAA